MSKFGLWSGITLAAVASGWLARVFLGEGHAIVSLFLSLSKGAAPSDVQLVFFAPALLLTVLATRNLIEGFLGASLFRSFKVLTVWAAGASMMWLVLQYFAGKLHGLDRVFPLLACGFLAATLIILRIALSASAYSGSIAVTTLVPVALIVSLQGEPGAILSDVWREFLASEPKRFFASPTVQPLTFSIAAIVSAFLLHGRVIKGTDIGARLVQLLVWSVATQILWIFTLFLLGVGGVPRLWPVMTAIAMVLTGASFIAIGIARERNGILTGLPSIVEDSAHLGLIASSLSSLPRRRVWLIANETTDARAVKFGHALAGQTWDIVFCSPAILPQQASQWKGIRLAKSILVPRRVRLVASAGERLGKFLARQGVAALASWGARLVEYCHLATINRRNELLWYASAHPEIKPDLVIAFSLADAGPAHSLARTTGAAFLIDFSDYPAEQFGGDANWVRDEKPLIVIAQKHYLKSSDVVTASSAGLVEVLASEISAKRQPLLIGNLPPNQPQRFRPVGERIKVLYQGDLSRHRELVAAIESVRLWRPEFDLILRGNGDPAHIGNLKRLAQRLNVDRRVFFETEGAEDSIVAMAAADVGFFCHGSISIRHRFLLPERLFDYVMAGLAVCVSELDEVGRIVTSYGIGKLISHPTPQSIAAAINSLSRDDIEQCKRASIVASGKLNWDVEGARLVDVCSQLVSQRQS